VARISNSFMELAYNPSRRNLRHPDILSERHHNTYNVSLPTLVLFYCYTLMVGPRKRIMSPVRAPS